MKIGTPLKREFLFSFQIRLQATVMPMFPEVEGKVMIRIFISSKGYISVCTIMPVTAPFANLTKRELSSILIYAIGSYHESGKI